MRDREASVTAAGRTTRSVRSLAIIDCDPGHDDAIALLLALGSPEIKLLGVTTVAGNSTLEHTTGNAIRILDHIGRQDIAVIAGAPRPLVREPRMALDVHGESGLDGSGLPPAGRDRAPEHATDWIARTVASNPFEVTLIATGPLTNVATFLARYPDVAAKLQRIVMMGGAVGAGNRTPAAEFNVWVDPEAAQRVFSSGLDVTMVGLDVTHQARMTQTYLGRLEAAGRSGQLIAKLHTHYGQFYRTRYGWEGAPVHDAVAVAHVIDPTILETRYCGVIVDTGEELSRGRTYVDTRGNMGWEPKSHVALQIDAKQFFELLIERIGALG
jgi:inosine-uridine nucleoside N-ribohydrolase